MDLFGFVIVPSKHFSRKAFRQKKSLKKGGQKIPKKGRQKNSLKKFGTEDKNIVSYHVSLMGGHHMGQLSKKYFISLKCLAMKPLF